MSYANGLDKKQTERRAIEIGRVRFAAADTHPLLEIRTGVRALCGQMADAVWIADPTRKPLDGKTLDAALLPFQVRSHLNSVWAECARMTVRFAITEQHQRRGRHLYGTLLNLDETKTDPKSGEVVFTNVPRDLAENPTRLRAFATQMRALTDAERSALAQRVFHEKATHLCAFGTDVIKAALTRSCERFACPSWDGKDEEKRVRLSLDPRSLLGGKAAGTLPERLLALTHTMTAAAGADGVLHVSGPRARTDAISLPFRLAPRAYARHGACAASAFCVEIGPRDAVIKLVLAKTRPLAPERVRFVLGRDFGYRNTVSLCLIDLGRKMPLDAARALAAQITTKSQARDHLTGNALPDRVKVLETRVFSGEGFMRRMNEIALRIDALRSEIDLSYARMMSLKATFLSETGADPDEIVPEECPADASTLAKKQHARFHRILGKVRALKAKRRALYRQADGAKASWFGFIANAEIKMAAPRGAAVISEDLTVEAEERDSPQYKGRAFNTLINHGAKGRYARAADAKAAWAGIPTLRVPSYHTSTTDVRNGVIEKTQRRGDVFTARADGMTAHADVHAAFTIGLWPFLRPKTKQTIVRKRLLPRHDATAA